MTFKVANDPQFHDKWQHLMHANERLLTLMHETMDDPKRINNAAAAVQLNLNWLMELVPAEAEIAIHVLRVGAFEATAADSKVQTNMIEPTHEGLVRFILFAPKFRIKRIAEQFKLGVIWR